MKPRRRTSNRGQAATHKVRRKPACPKTKVHCARPQARVQATTPSCEAKCNPASSTLLSIPPELRLAILEILLCRSEPIAPGEKNLAVNVLAVCRQLRREASILLYENNTFEIVIFDDNQHMPNVQMLNYAWSSFDNALEVPRIFCLVKNWRVVLRGCQKNYPIDDDDSYDDRQAIHWLCQMFSENVELESVSISIRVEYRQEYEEDNYIMDRILQPFTFLRKLAKVDVDGVDPTYARYVEAQMMSQTPAEDIWNMKNAFWSWCEYHNPKNDPINGIGAYALEAINDCDVTRFKEERETAVSQLAGRCLRSTKRVYQYDVPRG